MTPARKVTFIGAGSFGSTRALVRDLLTFTALAGSTIDLMDVDPERQVRLLGALLRFEALGSDQSCVADGRRFRDRSGES